MVMHAHVDNVRSGEAPASGTVSSGEHSQTLPCARAARRVLVADDDQSLRNLVADVFAFEGYFVTEASDEQGLLGCIHAVDGRREGQFDLVVIGFQAQGELGLETLTRIRNAGCQTPVIVLAARSSATMAPRLNELDALFLSKPFALENLRALANHVVHACQCGFSEVSPATLALTNSAPGSIDSGDSAHPQCKDPAE